jgi:hypothetical protein
MDFLPKNLLPKDLEKIILDYKKQMDDYEKEMSDMHMINYIIIYNNNNNNNNTKKEFKKIIRYYNDLYGFSIHHKGYIKLGGNWYELRTNYIKILDLYDLDYAFTNTGTIFID